MVRAVLEQRARQVPIRRAGRERRAPDGTRYVRRVRGRLAEHDPRGRLPMTRATAQSGYAPVNGIRLYYEVHGTGQPVVLLHGGLGAIEMFGDVLALLAQDHQVIAVDLQGHGRTADVDRPMRFESMADDIAALIHYLGLQNADVMGYS